MKTPRALALFLWAMLVSSCGCDEETGLRPGAQAVIVDALAVLYITGMDCPGCAERTKAVIKALPGVGEARVTLLPPEAEVEYEMDLVTTEQIIGAVKKLGFGATVKERRP